MFDTSYHVFTYYYDHYSSLWGHIETLLSTTFPPFVLCSFPFSVLNVRPNVFELHLYARMPMCRKPKVKAFNSRAVSRIHTEKIIASVPSPNTNDSIPLTVWNETSIVIWMLVWFDDDTNVPNAKFNIPPYIRVPKTITSTVELSWVELVGWFIRWLMRFVSKYKSHVNSIISFIRFKSIVFIVFIFIVMKMWNVIETLNAKLFRLWCVFIVWTREKIRIIISWLVNLEFVLWV